MGKWCTASPRRATCAGSTRLRCKAKPRPHRHHRPAVLQRQPQGLSTELARSSITSAPSTRHRHRPNASQYQTARGQSQHAPTQRRSSNSARLGPNRLRRRRILVRLSRRVPAKVAVRKSQLGHLWRHQPKRHALRGLEQMMRAPPRKLLPVPRPQLPLLLKVLKV